MLVKGYFIKPLLHYNAVLQIVSQKVGCYKKVHKVKSGAKEDDLSNIKKRLPKWILDEAQAGIKTAREISITSDTQMTSLLWQKAKKN